MTRLVNKTPLVIVAGFDRGATIRSAEALAVPGTAVVHHDLSLVGVGTIVRTVSTTDFNGQADSRTTQSALDHGCLSCAMREDVLPLLRALHRRGNVDRIVLALDPALEPEPLSWAITNVVVADVPGQVDGPAGLDVQIEAVIGCIHEGTWLEDATGDRILAEDDRGSAEDERTVAQLAVGHVDFADALVVHGQAADGWSGAKLFAVLKRLNPTAPIIMELPQRKLGPTIMRNLIASIPDGARRGVITGPHDPLLRGQPPLTPDCGVQVVEFETDRPFHPERLHDAIDVLLDGVVAARGRLWLATQPDEALWLESAGGGLRIATGGTWLSAMTDDQVAQANPERLAMASLRWHPLYGDRSSSIVAVSVDADPGHIRRTLAAAVLTDDELAAGQAGWHGLSDPFGVTHADPCDDMLDERALLEGTEPPAEWFVEVQDLAGPKPDNPGQNPEREDKS
ncbi:ribosome hibernation factor-recruiting GTPase MRF [Williamsia soli]|uniref:ribosome hibernation factor-recruiting GTPase MRF n=1 Tax=Williamsia soli TaxID=364929 RepID=UPI0027DC1A5C|nr:GTP-binding protein [Williamsia soli]